MLDNFSGLGYPDREACSKNGKRIYALKKKGEQYRQCYYLFELNENNCVDEEEKMNLNIFFTYMKITAKMLHIPLYDIEEVSIRIQEKQKELVKDGKPIFEKDFTIRIMDHATGIYDDLTLCFHDPNDPSWRK